jgi:hypothetical protein
MMPEIGHRDEHACEISVTVVSNAVHREINPGNCITSSDKRHDIVRLSQRRGASR